MSEILPWMALTLDRGAALLAKHGVNEGKFLLTIAVPSQPDATGTMPVGSLDQYLDFWNLRVRLRSDSHRMSIAHALYGNGSLRKLSAYKRKTGIPLYGHRPQRSNGSTRWRLALEPITYKAIPSSSCSNSGPNVAHGASIFHEQVDNLNQEVSFVCDWATGGLITFESAAIVQQKIEYAKFYNMGGMVFWTLHGDKLGTDESLIALAQKGFDHLKQEINHIKFPFSRYENINGRNGAAGVGLLGPGTGFGRSIMHEVVYDDSIVL
ncbi:uncharacterized protein IL334_005543 [Kwoniella shivajii]|uniref:GH18 domain-containing protein n=1 Tax=Kwoniella shivajii TaxID=564305 RepID=A0ABZ1D403_9TREE|nr:hypothetical protein IL334_005543 [Kwoniella shivajii]